MQKSRLKHLERLTAALQAAQAEREARMNGKRGRIRYIDQLDDAGERFRYSYTGEPISSDEVDRLSCPIVFVLAPEEVRDVL